MKAPAKLFRACAASLCLFFVAGCSDAVREVSPHAPEAKIQEKLNKMVEGNGQEGCQVELEMLLHDRRRLVEALNFLSDQTINKSGTSRMIEVSEKLGDKDLSLKITFNKRADQPFTERSATYDRRLTLTGDGTVFSESNASLPLRWFVEDEHAPLELYVQKLAYLLAYHGVINVPKAQDDLALIGSRLALGKELRAGLESGHAGKMRVEGQYSKDLRPLYETWAFWRHLGFYPKMSVRKQGEKQSVTYFEIPVEGFSASGFMDSCEYVKTPDVLHVPSLTEEASVSFERSGGFAEVQRDLAYSLGFYKDNPFEEKAVHRALADADTKYMPQQIAHMQTYLAGRNERRRVEKKFIGAFKYTDKSVKDWGHSEKEQVHLSWKTFALETGIVKTNVSCEPDPWLASALKSEIEFQITDVDLMDVGKTEVKMICGDKYRTMPLWRALGQLHKQAQRSGLVAQRPAAQKGHEATTGGAGAAPQATP